MIELFLVEIRCAAGNDLLDLAGLLSCYQSICCKSCYIAVPCGGAAGCALCYAVYPVLKLYIVGIDETKDPVLLDCGCNFKVLSGGISKANCDKIAKCLDMAEKNSTPVIYLLNTVGVQVGEGVTVLEGLAKVLMRSTQLKGVVPQYAIVDGEMVFGDSVAYSYNSIAAMYNK